MFQKLVELAKEVHKAGLSHDCIYDIVSYVKENNQLPQDELFQELNKIVDDYKEAHGETVKYVETN
ncbi:hypothetical protein [Sporomusa aerivorans]|uniref:hypothetical protein n=1 Tax=Sporomusa aerivorans TaxID=204936 RepID=UPI00352A6DCA